MVVNFYYVTLCVFRVPCRYSAYIHPHAVRGFFAHWLCIRNSLFKEVDQKSFWISTGWLVGWFVHSIVLQKLKRTWRIGWWSSGWLSNFQATDRPTVRRRLCVRVVGGRCTTEIVWQSIFRVIPWALHWVIVLDKVLRLLLYSDVHVLFTSVWTIPMTPPS